jgi:hypothetical protein
LVAAYWETGDTSKPGNAMQFSRCPVFFLPAPLAVEANSD